MDSRGDRRAQAMQVGAVALVGVAIVALSIYQVTSVPQQNRQVEATQRGGSEQLLTVRAAILETARTGVGHVATVSLGLEYSDRVAAVNPSSPSGTLWTTMPGPTTSLAIENATATGPETADFWNGSTRTYEIRGVVYVPGYNEFDGAPVTAHGHSLVYDLYGTNVLELTGTFSDSVALSNQTLIDGREITVVTLGGSFSAIGLRTSRSSPGR